MRFILPFILCFFSFLLSAQETIIIKTLDDLKKIKSLDVWIIFEPAEDDPIKFDVLYREFEKALAKRLEEIAPKEEKDYSKELALIHECYFTDTIEEIASNKTIGGNHNPVLKLLDLKKSGREKDKIQRIIDKLIELGYRDF